MSLQTILWAQNIKTGSPRLKLVLTLLAQSSSGDHAAVLNVDELAKECEMEPAELSECLALLAAKGLLTRSRQGAGYAQLLVSRSGDAE